MALTKQLATSIKSSLEREHIESQYMKDLIDEKSVDLIKETIFSKFDVLTFSEVIEDWFPEDSFAEGWETSTHFSIESKNRIRKLIPIIIVMPKVISNIMFDKKQANSSKKPLILIGKLSYLLKHVKYGIMQFSGNGREGR